MGVFVAPNTNPDELDDDFMDVRAVSNHRTKPKIDEGSE